MKFVIDSIEDGKAVLENSSLEHTVIDGTELPEGAKEGSVLIYENERYILSVEDTSLRRQILFQKQQKLFKKKNDN